MPHDEFSSYDSYNAPYYFVLLIAALLPMILTLAIKGTRWPWYQTLVTLVFLYISFGGEFWQQGVALIVYVIYQTLLTWGYAAYRKIKMQVGSFIWLSF